MYSFDASSMIHAWDNYPISNPHFKSFWQWFSDQLDNKQFSISKTAFDEVKHKIPECGEFLKKNNVNIYPLTAVSLSTAQRIKTLLDIVEEKYRGGVGENDLFIIAVAKETGTTLISEEKRQSPLPTIKANYRIPAVCNMSEVDTDCIGFLELLK